MVSGTYDESKTSDAGRYKTGRFSNRAGGCKNSGEQQKSGYRYPGKRKSPSDFVEQI